MLEEMLREDDLSTGEGQAFRDIDGKIDARKLLEIEIDPSFQALLAAAYGKYAEASGKLTSHRINVAVVRGIERRHDAIEIIKRVQFGNTPGVDNLHGVAETLAD